MNEPDIIRHHLDAGYCKAWKDKLSTKTFKMIIRLNGRLESYRSKKINISRNKIVNQKQIRAEQEKWYILMSCLPDCQRLIRELTFTAASVGVKVYISVTVYRGRKIRDRKDLMAGVDHAILDMMVNQGMLLDDDDDTIDFHVKCIKKEKPDLEYVYMYLAWMEESCRKSVTERANKLLISDAIEGYDKIKTAKYKVGPRNSISGRFK